MLARTTVSRALYAALAGGTVLVILAGVALSLGFSSLDTFQNPALAKGDGPGTTHGQSPELRDAVIQGRTLYNEGRYLEALPLHEKAVGLVEQEFGVTHPTFAIHLNNLAMLYFVNSRDIEAERLYKRALSIFEKVLPNHYEVAITLENYADFLRVANRSYEAEVLEARAAAIRAKQAE